MPEVDSWLQSVSGIFPIYFATFCYFSHLLNSFSNFDCIQSNFLTEETSALHWNVGVFPLDVQGKPRENPVWTVCRYKNSQ